MRVTTKDSVGPALVKFYQESGFLFSKKQKKKIQKISEFIYFDVWGEGKTEILIGEEKASDGENVASLKVNFGYSQQVTLWILVSQRGKVTELEIEIKEIRGESFVAPIFKPRKWKTAAREAKSFSQRWTIS